MKFGNLPEEFSNRENSQIWLQSIPYDGTSTYGKGSDKGFEAMIHASHELELYDIETNSEVYERGIHCLAPIAENKSPELVFEKVYSETKNLLKRDKFLTFFGGEHSISIGVIKAFHEKFDKLTVLQLDAHADLRPEYMGTQYNHACALHQAGQIVNLLQVGIRSMDSSELEFMDKSKVFFAQDIHGKTEWMDASIKQMTEDVYLTIDLDVFDPSIMPSTGTPEPGGMLWYQTMSYLKKVFRTRNVVGFDIVELAPKKGFTAPDFLAAKLYYKLLSYKFEDYD
ncbi:agmatinase [Salibacteraceae bacterium]|jgi:agmatinase|nr:agmatinase [Salibacteraceae bacterium]